MQSLGTHLAVFFLGAALFEKLAGQRLQDLNQNGFSDWKKSFVISSATNEVDDIHNHLDKLDKKRSTLMNGGNITPEALNIMYQTNEVRTS